MASKENTPGANLFNSIATAIVIAASLLLPPSLYGLVAYTNLDMELQADATIVAETVKYVVARSPQTWSSDTSLLREAVNEHSRMTRGLHDGTEQIRIFDNNKHLVATIGDATKRPTMMRSAQMLEDGSTLGHIDTERSLRPLLINTILLSLFGAALAAASLVTLRIIPMRAAEQTNETLRRNEASLTFANSVLTAATEGSPDAILIVDKDARIVSYNQHFIDLWRVPLDLIEGVNDEPLLAMVAAQAREPDTFRARVDYLYRHAEDTANDRIDLKDGRILERFTKALYGEDRTYLGRIWFFRDVSEREHSAEALKESEARFRAIFDNARDGIAVLEAESRKFLMANRRFCEMIGYTPEQFKSLGIADIHAPEDMPRVLHEVSRYDRGESYAVFDLPVMRKDGSKFFADVNSAPVEMGGRDYLIGIFRDSAERHAAEEAVRRSEEKYRNLVESTSDFIWEIDETNRYTYYSPTVTSLLGYAPGELLGKTPFDIMPAAEAERASRVFARIAAGRQPFSMIENTVMRKDGTVAVLETSGVPIFDAEGVYRGYRGIERDITKRKRAEQATQAMLQRTQDQLQAVGQLGQAEALLSGEVEALAHEITELAAAVSGCERVNIWLFNDEQTELHCIDLFERTPGRHSRGMVLREADFRHEIGVIKASKYVNADDPLTDPRTKGYAESYLKPLKITSMLDAVIQASGITFGLLCFEHVGQPHHWEQDEIAFAVQLADKVGLSLISRMRREAEAALRRRDALLHATALSAADLITEANLDEAINRALANVSQTVEVDRMTVLERSPSGQGSPMLRYSWQAPNINKTLDAAFLESPALLSPQILAWQAPLAEGKTVFTNVKTVTGDVKWLLDSLGIKSMLIVPISVDGRYWGQVGFDNCREERGWQDFEIDILKTLGDLIGGAIQRDRYMREIADANRIVQNTPTILYRMRGEPALPMIYISQNIRLFGYEPAVLMASPQLYKNLIHSADIQAVRDSMAHVLEDHGPGGTVEFRLLTSSGAYRWFENRFSAIRDGSGRLLEIEGLLFDITERKASEERIALLARTDPLTGLANRSTFIERLRQSFAAARRGAASFAVLYIDIDRFKDVNDTLGHPVGDRLLVTVAERFHKTIRETDVVARFGGDEFSVLQNDLSDTADAGALATKLQSALAEPIVIDGNELRITASIGISIYDAETAAPEDLLAQADVALYRAKEEGRDQYRFHTEELDIQVREEVALADELRHALSRNELRLFYQPQVELSSSRIVGMEALIRWQHPQRGLLTPSYFLAIAERTGLITTIGQWVLTAACQQMQRWQQDGIAPQTIAVNISSAQIKTGSDFIQFVTETLEKYHLAPANLELDVTESMLARAALAQNDVLEKLQGLGVKISIDDFGTKYSTLDYLRTYRVNRLKIPQALTDRASHDPQSAAMVRAIVGIARELNIEVIAQGIETQDQWSFLTMTSPVTRVQGYYFSEPVPPQRAAELLQQGRILATQRA